MAERWIVGAVAAGTSEAEKCIGNRLATVLTSNQSVMNGGRFALTGRLSRAGFPFRATTLFPSERGYFVFENGV